MPSTVLDRPQTEPAVSVPLDLPSSDSLSGFRFLNSGPGLPMLFQLTLADAVAPSFVVDSLARADWAVSKILKAEARNSRRAELAATLHERVDSWLTKASAAELRLRWPTCSSLLRPFVESETSKQRRSRSLVLPSGTAQLTSSPTSSTSSTRDAALSYCESSHPEAVIVAQRPLSLGPQDAHRLPGRGRPRLLISSSAPTNSTSAPTHRRHSCAISIPFF